MSSKVLCNGNGIPVVPEVAEALGLREAILLQQIHYWILQKENHPRQYEGSYKDGSYWFYGTFGELAADYPMLGSERTIRRMVDDLSNKRVLIVEKKYEHRGDHTHWYRINHEVLDMIYDHQKQITLARREKIKEDYASSGSVKSDTLSEPVTKCQSDCQNVRASDKMAASYTKTTPKTTPETSNKEHKRHVKNSHDACEKKDLPPSDGEIFWKRFKRTAGKGSKKLFFTRWRKLSAEDKQLAIEHYDKMCAKFPTWASGEQYVPQPQNYLSKEYWLHEVDFDAPVKQPGQRRDFEAESKEQSQRTLWAAMHEGNDNPPPFPVEGQNDPFAGVTIDISDWMNK